MARSNKISAAFSDAEKNEVVTKTFKGPDGKIVTKEVELFTWEKLDFVDAVKAKFSL